LPFEVRRSAIHGRGAFATRRIRPGTLLIEYTGERISFDEAAERYDDESMTHHHTFLFQIGDDVLIDAGRGGNAARFINHSCAPNCAAYLQRGRVYIEAIRNIQPGVELTYDYALQLEGRPRPEWKRRYACHCGAPNCRGTVLKPRKRPRPRRR
jgi:SET domain-containing protein